MSQSEKQWDNSDRMPKKKTDRPVEKNVGHTGLLRNQNCGGKGLHKSLTYDDRTRCPAANGNLLKMSNLNQDPSTERSPNKNRSKHITIRRARRVSAQSEETQQQGHKHFHMKTESEEP